MRTADSVRQIQYEVPVAAQAGGDTATPAIAFLSMAAGFGFLACSPMLLTHVGFNYGSTGGSAFEKVHPASLVAVAALGLAALKAGPVALADRIHARTPGAFVAALCFAAFTSYLIVALRAPFTFAIDTLLMPVAMLILIPRLGADDRRRLETALHVFMAVNAAIAITEMTFGVRLIPFYLQEGAVSWDWRSTSLLGHPLGNANLTAVYIVILALGGGRMSPRVRGAAVVIQLAAMASFGGRAATAITVLVAGAAFAAQAWRWLARGHITIGDAVRICAVAAALLIGVALLVESGFFDRFIERTEDDQGSAATRSRMFDLFDYFDVGQLIVGPDPDVLATLSHQYGLDYGIESFVIAWILYFGIAAALMAITGLVALTLAIYRVAGWRATVGMAVFIAINATSHGIAGKSLALLQAVVVTLAILTPAQKRVER